jgi:hypothetical protein
MADVRVGQNERLEDLIADRSGNGQHAHDAVPEHEPSRPVDPVAFPSVPAVVIDREAHGDDWRNITDRTRGRCGSWRGRSGSGSGAVRLGVRFAFWVRGHGAVRVAAAGVLGVAPGLPAISLARAQHDPGVPRIGRDDLDPIRQLLRVGKTGTGT